MGGALKNSGNHINKKTSDSDFNEKLLKVIEILDRLVEKWEIPIYEIKKHDVDGTLADPKPDMDIQKMEIEEGGFHDWSKEPKNIVEASSSMGGSGALIESCTNQEETKMLEVLEVDIVEEKSAFGITKPPRNVEKEEGPKTCEKVHTDSKLVLMKIVEEGGKEMQNGTQMTIFRIECGMKGRRNG